MPRNDDEHERRIAVSVQHEEAETPDNQGVVSIWDKGIPDPEIMDVICEDCCHEFAEEDPDKCPICGSTEIAEN